MQVYQGLKDLKQQKQLRLHGSVVTIGNFDGVHWGHRQLLQALKQEAQALGSPAIVYTFHPHPLKVLHPERQTQRLFDLQDQQEQFFQAGVDHVIIEDFTKEFAQVSAQAFLQDYIVAMLRPKTIVVGHDFSFGANREGDLHFLEKFCATHGIRLLIIPPFQLDGRVVSSSKIRDELKLGDVEKAQTLLGRKYYLRGHVEKGFQRGRTIGVPTANIHPDVEFVPRKGVYVTLTGVDERIYPSITNIGLNPTFNEDRKGPVKIETHLFDFHELLYGFEVRVYLLHFLRDEQKFSGLDELKQQIQKDLQEARTYFDEHPPGQ